MAILLLVSHHRRYTRRSEMKAIIAAVISIAFLMGAPSVRATQADTEQEAGVAKDAQGRTCDFGPAQDECPNASNSMPPGSKNASGDNVTGFAILPPGQHYGQCEEVGKDNELGCDVIIESDLPNGYKQGIADAKSGQIVGDEITNRTGDYMNGYIMGYCSVHHAAQYHRPYHDNVPEFNLNCSQPIYPDI